MRLSCLRHVLFSFNCLFWIFGLVLMALGLFAEFDPAFVHRLVTFVDGIEDTFTPDNVTSGSDASASTTESPLEAVATYVRLMSHGVIALGAAIGVVAFTGCCGAWRESKRCLSLFFALLLLCLLFTLLLGGALFFAAVAASAEKEAGGVSFGASTPTASSSSAGASGKKLDPVVAKIAAGFKSLVEAAWNALTHAQRLAFERANSCCGLDDPGNLMVVLDRADCGSDMASKGCFDKVVSVIGRNFAIFGAAMLLLAAIEVAAMTLSCMLFQRIRKSYGAV